MLKFWNTANRKVEEFVPLTPGQVGMYACGPTVYQRAHIGNLRTYLMEDLLRRVLRMRGFEVRHVMNITDVGHLTDDADQGEDKMDKASRTTGRSAWDIAAEYTRLFEQDLETLCILKPTVMPRATDCIQEQIALIQELERRGFTYTTSDGVYFDTAAFSDYGKFSGQALAEKEEGARIGVNAEKRNPTDFALWKFSYPQGRPFDATQDDGARRRQMEWESPWGVGFPGWHIECSAMSRKELGQPFDIHAGGVDHIPVHHENEIAQSVAAFEVPLARYWFHVDFLLVDGQKMSKSLGNGYTLDDITQRGFDPMAFRYFLLGASYRQKQNFTWDALQAAQNALHRLRSIVRDWQPADSILLDIEAEFMEALDDDLNVPRALAVMWKLIDRDASTASKAATLLYMDEVLGLGLQEYIAHPVQIPTEIQALMEQREVVRQAKDWSASDRLRDEIVSRGWIVEDTGDGQKISPKSTFSI